MNSTDFNKLRYEQLPWTEKYRPSSFDDIILNDNLMNMLKSIMEKDAIPNLICIGPSGVGKTSTINALSNYLYGPYVERCVLELNASDDRGIKTIQSNIINFCKTSLIYPSKDNNKYSKYKLVILDDADSMVERVQPQINNIMELFKDSVRFIFTCNVSSKIIEAIQSRCLLLRFSRLDCSMTVKRLKTICKNENIDYDANGLKKIYEYSNGDLRSAINVLQLIYNTKGEIKTEHVMDIFTLPQYDIIMNLFSYVIKNDLINALKILYELKNNGYSGSDIILGMIQTLKSSNSSSIAEDTKIKLMNCICLGAYRTSKGIDSLLQLVTCVTDMIISIN